MTKIIDKAYLFGGTQFEMLKKKFPAFCVADVVSENASEAAIDEGRFKGKGRYLLSESSPTWGNSYVYYVSHMGDVGDCPSMLSNLGLRYGLNYKYDPKSTLVKSATEETRNAVIENNCDLEEVTSTAPIVTTSKGVKYIWLNKEECECGKAETMDLFLLDIEEYAEAYDANGRNNSYADANSLRKQIVQKAKESMSEEEWAMVVPVEMSEEDGYDKVTPILETAGEKD